MVDEKTEHMVRIDYPLFESTVPAYATNFVMQNTGREFVLGYYVVLPPSVVSTPGADQGAIKTRLAAIESVPAQCVARVVLTHDRCIEVARVMVRTLRDAGVSLKELGVKDGD